MDLQELSRAQSFASIYCISNRYPGVPYLKPINICTPSHFHYSSRRNSLSHISAYKETLESKQKGFIFEWPQRRKFYSERELCLVIWMLAHTMYWMHIAHLFPCGTALELRQPPWRYRSRLPKPENRDYIIEPDWDSRYL